MGGLSEKYNRQTCEVQIDVISRLSAPHHLHHPSSIHHSSSTTTTNLAIMAKQSSATPNAKNPFPYESLSDCDRPACDDIVSMFQKASKAASDAESVEKGNAKPSTTTDASVVGTSERAISKEKYSVDDVCPPSSAKLGRSTWTLLHTMAAWYPDAPSETDQTSIKSFFTTLSRFYPCPWCAHDFQHNLEEKPPQ
jgi:Erv1 / Alr family